MQTRDSSGRLKREVEHGRDKADIRLFCDKAETLAVTQEYVFVYPFSCILVHLRRGCSLQHVRASYNICDFPLPCMTISTPTGTSAIDLNSPRQAFDTTQVAITAILLSK